jgi:hypothetical protein
MKTLHDTFIKAVGQLPKQIFRQLLTEKLKSYGIEFSPQKQRQLETIILNGESKTFHLKRWRWWERENIVLDFNEEDIQEIEQRFDEVVERLPQLIEDISNQLSNDLLVTLKKKWRGELRRQRRETAGFQKRLLARWGLPLDLLRMLLTISREFGDSVNQELRKTLSPNSNHLIEVLTRLHARACQVVDEILVLLSVGFADGAMARWRTLHEIAVVALFIGKHGDELAERYILHQHVESRWAMRDYVACQERLGYEPVESDEVAAVEQSYEATIDRFGQTFGNQYGWAADKLKNSNPKFANIERAVGISHFRAHYRMASHNVHGNPKGVFFKLGLIKDMNILPAGPSIFGLADPGHSAAISLVQISAELALLHPTLDNIVMLRIMHALEGEIGQTFGDAHQKLVDDVG